jgi:hypothetical protein
MNPVKKIMRIEKFMSPNRLTAVFELEWRSVNATSCRKTTVVHAVSASHLALRCQRRSKHSPLYIADPKLIRMINGKMTLSRSGTGMWPFVAS